MKIISDKLSPIANKAPVSDQQSSSQAESAPNFFLDLMNSISNDQPEKTTEEPSEISLPEKGDSQNLENEEQAQLLYSLGLQQDIDPVLAPVNQNNTSDIVQKQIEKTKSDAKEAYQLLEAKAAQANLTMAKENKPVVTQVNSALTQSDLAKELTEFKKVADNNQLLPKEFTSKDLLNAKLTDKLPIDPVIQPKLTEADAKLPVSDALMKNVIENNNVIEDMAPDKLHKPKTVNAKKITQDIAIDSQSPQIMKDQKPIVTLLQPLKDLAQDQSSQHMKYVNALSQMTGAINSHMFNNGNKLEQTKLLSTMTSEHATFAESMSQANKPYDCEINVEITPATANSIAKEVYDTKIKMHPAELGQITAKLRIDKNNAELVIMTENNHVKHIVESNLAQLRDNFLRADINLTSIQVDTPPSQSSHSDLNNNNDQKNEKFIAQNADEDIQNNTNTAQKNNKRSDKIVDTYA